MARQSNPTTSFRVDISDLKRGIAEANRQIRLANSEFRAASDGTREWERSTDGLSARITQFERVIAAENSKLESLREQHRRVVEAEGEHSSAAEELEIRINNQRAAVTRAERSLQDYSAALEETRNESNHAESEMNDLSDSLDDVDVSSENASGGFTVLKGALASLVADGIRAGISALKDLATESDKAMTSFQAKTGASAEEMERFNDEINDLYKSNYGESIEDVADSMAQVAQTSKEVDPSKIKELTESAITMRDTFGFEVNETMRAANMLMDQFGISGEEAFNLIAQGAQNGLDKNGDLLDSINEYSVHYKQLGFDGEEFFNSLMNGAAAGTFSVDKLGDAMKEFGIRTKDTAESTSEGFELIGLDADEMRAKFAAGGESAKEATQETLNALFEMDSAVAQNLAGVDLFGTMWEDLGIEGVKALMDVTGEADRMKGTMDEIKSIKYSDIGSQFTEIGRIIKTDFIQPLAETALPVIKDGLTWVKDNMNDIIPVATAVGAAILTAFATTKIVAFAGFIAGLVAKFKTATTVVGGFKAVFAALNITMTANPIGLIVTAIAALVAAFITLWNTSDTFRAFWINLWESLKSTVSTVVDGIVLFFTETIPNAFQAVTDFFTNNWQQILKFLINPFGEGFKLLYNNFEGFKATVDGFVQAVIGFFSNLPENIYNIIVSVIAHIIAWGVYLYQFATTKIPEFIENVISFFATLPGRIWTWLVNAHNKIVEWGVNIVTAGGQKSLEFIDKVIEFFRTLPEKIWEWLVESFNKIVEWGSNMIAKGTEVAADTVESITTIFKDLPSSLMQIGKDLVRGLWEGMSSMTGWVVDKVKGFGEDVLNSARDIFGVHSPATTTAEIGKYLDEGLAVGMEDNANKVIDSFKNLVDGVLSVGDSEVSLNGENIGAKLSEEVASGISKKQSKAQEEAQKLGETILSAAQQKLDNFKVYNDMTLKEEMHFWDEIRKQCAEGTQARIDADKKYLDARKAYENEISESVKHVTDIMKSAENDRQKAYEDYDKKCNDARKKYEEDRTKLLETAEKDRATLQSEYQEKVKSAYEKYESDKAKLTEQYENDVNKIISDKAAQRQQIIDKYNQQLQQRTEAIYNSLGLFDNFDTSTDQTAEELLGNLQSQVDGMKNWQEDLTALEGKGLDEALLAELQAMGPKAAAQIDLLANMTDEQLTQYTELWKQKMSIAESAAKIELRPVLDQTNADLAQLNLDTQLKLEQLATTYKTNLDQIGTDLNNSLMGYKADLDMGMLSIENTLRTNLSAIKAELNKSLDEYETDLHTSLSSIEESVTNDLEEMGVKFLDLVVGNIAQTGEQASQEAGVEGGKFVNTMSGAVAPLTPMLNTIGGQAMQGFWNGMRAVADSLESWFRDFCQSLIDEAEEVLDIGSPSRVFRQIGKWTLQGFSNGVSDESKSMLASIGRTFSGVVDTVGGILEPVSGMLQSSKPGNASTLSPNSRNVVYNFNQTNNSPKSLSRLEIYRQSKNLLKGVVVSV